VTIAVSTSASIRVAILEYAGLATTNPLDVTAAQALSSTAADSGAAIAAAAGELYLGAISTQSYRSDTAGPGFTVREAVSAAPSTAWLVEDRVATSAAPQSASATLSSTDSWAAAVAVFKPQNGGPAPSPTITSLSPTSGPVGTPVTITGSNFGAAQGT